MDDDTLLKPHGLPAIPWDYVSIPTTMWETSTVIPTGCWKAPQLRARGFRHTMIARLTGINPMEVYAAVPTCGNLACWRPDHVCITLTTAGSSLEV